MSEKMMADVTPATDPTTIAPPVQESITAEIENALYSNKVEEVSQPVSKKPEASETEVVSPKENKEEEKSDSINYKLSLKEGSLLDTSFIDEVTSFAKEHGLSNEAAQAVLSKQESLIERLQKAESERQDKELEQWRKTVIEDKVMGGANLAKTAENAKKVVSRFGNSEFIKLLNETGYGDHPEIVRFLSTIGSVISDDSLVMPKNQMPQKSAVEIFYGSN